MTNRGEPLSVSNTILQDIAALKQSQADMRRSIDENNRSSQQAFSAMNGRLDSMTDLLQAVARIAERQEAQGTGLNRAFNEISRVKEHADTRVDEIERWQEGHQKENAVTERRLAVWHGIALGVSLVSAVTVSLFAWTGNDILNNMREDVRESRDVSKRNDERLDRLERIEAQYHGSDR